MTAPVLVVTIVMMLLVAAAFFDLTTYTIPNSLTFAMMVLFVTLMLAMSLDGRPMSWNQAGWHALAFVFGLIGGMGFFAAGWVGGGDAKLFAVASLWLGWDAMFEYTIVSSILGGFLTLALLFFRRLPLPALLAAQPWLMRLADPKAGVPYGVALAIAAITVLPETELFKLAAIH